MASVKTLDYKVETNYVFDLEVLDVLFFLGLYKGCLLVKVLISIDENVEI